MSIRSIARMVTNERYDASEVDVAKMAKEILAARLQYQQTRAANRSLRIAQRETIPAVVAIVGTPGPYEVATEQAVPSRC
jgi:hypothetical protein